MCGLGALARTPHRSQSPWLISSSASAAPRGDPAFLCRLSTSRWAPGEGCARCRCLGRVSGVCGSRSRKGVQGRREEGTGRPQSPKGSRMSLRNSDVPPRTAWPWPPSSCRPVCSRPFRLPWLPLFPQTAPCNCSSSETAASFAATATPPAPEARGPASGAVWPPLSSSREPVRAQCPARSAPQCLPRAPSPLRPALPTPTAPLTPWGRWLRKGPLAIWGRDKGRRHPIKEGIAGDKALEDIGIYILDLSNFKKVTDTLRVLPHLPLPSITFYPPSFPPGPPGPSPRSALLGYLTPPLIWHLEWATSQIILSLPGGDPQPGRQESRWVRSPAHALPQGCSHPRPPLYLGGLPSPLQVAVAWET